MSESIVKDEENISDQAGSEQMLPEAQDNIQPAQSPGTQLAARREALGLTLERVAEQLKISPRQILAIESDNHSSFHSQSIFRGFVRAYAKVLKMDPEALMSLLPNGAPNMAQLMPVRNSVPTPFSESRVPFKSGRNSHAMWMMIAIGTVILLIAVLMGQKMGWLPALPKSITQKFEKTPASAPVSTPASAPTSVVATKPDNNSASATAQVDGKEKTKQIELPAVDVSSQLASQSAAAPAAAAPDGTNAVPGQAEGASETPVAAAASSGNALVLKAREESWIELRRANGSVLYKGTIPAGGSETIEIAEPVQLTLGNGPGVDATMRGAPLEIPVDKYSKVVRLSLK